PELPEVQTVVNDLMSSGLIGATITDAQVFWPRTVSKLSPAVFCQRIKQQRLKGVRRRGKYILFDLSGPYHLLIHLRMTGRLNLVESSEPGSKHEHVILNFENQRQLRFHDTRKFGRFYLVQDPETIVGHLGPEPLAPSFTATVLADRLSLRQRMLKPLLLDQSFIAGLGNIYVDEALWEAKLHPCRTASSLSKVEIRSLHRAVLKVLKQALKNLGTTLGAGKSNYYSIAKNKGRNRDRLMVFRRTDLPCFRCSTVIERIVVSQRSTHICPGCQQLEKGENNENRQHTRKSKNQRQQRSRRPKVL
ncbi:MAG: bifunctional DNA-formamidopyrimidine glycosylase/DNA-(apurinic or apyrimidinic site) lyase, partial [Proteobacteria bacterium]|nr:bifunctional DNA-formamidopyrimidine glycosylase/DNA-(apurinic or apyrimidinic site) lyase [Pseudomonadota bacterium]